MFINTRARCCGAALPLLVVLACGRPSADPHGPSLQESTVAPDGAVGYARGPWWRADLNYTLVGVAHILVAHRQSALSERLLSVPGPAPSRSREEALARALELGRALLRDPTQFAALARDKSDDARSAPYGGALGAVYLPHLPDAIVDALGNIALNEVSRVVETSLGFHVVQRFPVALEQRVSAAEIVIAYDGNRPTPRRGRELSRTRDEALAIAQRVRALAKADPNSFEQLVDEYSDAETADFGGDYGEWSTYAREGESLVLHVLGGLAPAAISEVVDTPLGLRVFARTAAARPPLAASVLVLGYHSERLPDEARTREEAREIADGALAELVRAPARFEQLREHHCKLELCPKEPVDVAHGRGWTAGLASVVREVAIGEVAHSLVEAPGLYMIARRADPARVPPGSSPQVGLEIPRPEPITLSNARPQDLVWYLDQLRAAALRELALNPETTERFNQIFDEMATAYATSAPEDRELFSAQVRAELLAALGPKNADRLSLIHQRLTDEVMGRLGAARVEPR